MKKKEVKEKNNKKKKNKKRIGLKIFFVLLLALAIAGGIFAYKMHKNGGGLQGFLATAVGHDEQTLKNLSRINFLVLGISGYEDYKLADSIMVCSYDPKNQDAAILSIPRDTYVGKNLNRVSASYKINSTYRNGENIEGMKDYVEELTGLEIPYYVVVDTDALRKLVDEIGGVTFNVPIDMKYDDYSQDLHIDLKAGEQLITGQKAEWLLRFRHGNDGETYSYEYGDNDYGRMRTQREFIMATAKQTLKAENLFKINKILDIIYEHVQTNMTLSDIKDYVPYCVNFNTDNLKTGMLPGVSTNKYGGIWIYLHDKEEAKEMVDEMFTIPEVTVETEEDEQTSNTTTSTSKIKIELLNGSGVTSNLSEVKKLLQEEGYEVTKTGNTSVTSRTTIINRTMKPTEQENKIKDILDTGIVSSGTDNSNVDFTIIIGKDY